MSMVRVCNITFDWYPFDPLVRRLSEAAVAGGDKVDVICLRQANESRQEMYHGVQIYRLPMGRGFGRSLPKTVLTWCCFLVIAAIKITRLHMKHRYQVVHVHNIPDFLVFAALIPKWLGAKVILHVQDTTPELMAAKARGKKQRLIMLMATWQERISTSFADHVITVGWPFEQLLLQRGVSPQKLTIILNSADPKMFPPERCTDSSPAIFSAERPFILMYHGTLAERNGLDIAVRALAIALKSVPYVRLDIKGRGEHLPTLKSLAEELGIADHVVFTEPCPSAEIVDFVVHGDVGIIPYRKDIFMELVLPTKAYEFAWMHRPMIVSDTRAIRSMFRPESLVLCDSTQPASFADAIIDLYLHPEKRASLILHAIEDYEPYQWEAMASRYQQVLANLAWGKEQEKQQYVVTSK